jgi:beta-lactamase regulating signal transducer with metallopeptidase domain
MENHLTQITNYLLTQSWQIAVLAVVIAAMSLALKNRSAHIRYLLWLIVLAKCLAPPLVTIPLAILPQESLVEPVPILPAELPAATIERVNTAITEPPIPISAPAVKEKAVRLTVHQWLGFGWVVGVAVFAVFGVIKALRTNLWLCRQRKPLPAELQTTIEDLFSGFDLKTLPKIWLLEGISQPFVWGLLRGSIYLPANFVKVDNAEYRKGVLGHELSHILRFDAAVNLLQVMAQAIFWFHPFVWWANKKIRGEREKCCDEMAIARLGAKVRDYSSAIVNILISEQESTRPVPSLAVAGPVKNIEERIKTMLRPGKKFYKRPSLVAVTVALLIGLVTIPTALVLTARGQAQPTAQSVDKLAQLPNKPAAASEKPEQPR